MRRSRLFRALALLSGAAGVTAAVNGSSPVVGLSHLTIVPDSATFAAIASSEFLRDTFALIETMPAAGAERIALVGRSTYVEFRRPADAARVWTSGVALGTDERGALRTLEQRLTSEFGPVHLDSISLRRDSTDIPWLYRLASNIAPDSALALKVVEYHPQFVRRWFGAASPSVARADVLAMHGAAARRFPFVDVVAVKIAAPAESADAIISYCRALGWRVRPAANGRACSGSDVRLFVVPAQQSERGVVAFTMQIKPGVNSLRTSARTLGKSTLRVSRTGLATWEFHSNP